MSAGIPPECMYSSAPIRRLLSTLPTPPPSLPPWKATLGAILLDWHQLLQPPPPPSTSSTANPLKKHDYAKLYRPDVRFRLAPEGEDQPGGLTIKGRTAFRLFHPALKMAVRWWVAGRLGGEKDRARLVIIQKVVPRDDGDEGPPRRVSFKWKIEDRLDATSVPLISGMAHYGFHPTGQVQWIQIDRLVPPLRSGLLSLLAAYIKARMARSPAI